MCDADFDYTLIIEYERLSNIELRSILQALQHCSSECYLDIELLSDEVIFRMNQCEYTLREKINRELVKLILETFEVLKRISKYMQHEKSHRVNQKILLIHTNFNRFVHGNPSPAASPVVSPTVETPVLDGKTSVVKLPKIMKKVRDMRK